MMDESLFENKRRLLGILGRLNTQTIDRVFMEISQLDIPTTLHLNRLSQTIFSICRDPEQCALFAKLFHQINEHSDENWRHYFVAEKTSQWLWVRDIHFPITSFSGPFNTKEECIALITSFAYNNAITPPIELISVEHSFTEKLLVKCGYCRDENSWYSQYLPIDAIDPVVCSTTLFPTKIAAEKEASLLFSFAGQIIELCITSLQNEVVLLNRLGTQCAEPQGEIIDEEESEVRDAKILRQVRTYFSLLCELCKIHFLGVNRFVEICTSFFSTAFPIPLLSEGVPTKRDVIVLELFTSLVHTYLGKLLSVLYSEEERKDDMTEEAKGLWTFLRIYIDECRRLVGEKARVPARLRFMCEDIVHTLTMYC